jgi:predicted anti-sigma-YlaC factor YlaD
VDANAFIVEYLEQELDESTKASFEAHVGKCEVCSRFLDQYASTIDLCKSEGRIAAPPELVETTLDFLRDRGIGRD